MIFDIFDLNFPGSGGDFLLTASVKMSQGLSSMTPDQIADVEAKWMVCQPHLHR